MYTLYTPHTANISLILLYSVPPVINSSDIANSPGNCLDLTRDLENSQRVGVEMCLRAGRGAVLILHCQVLEGIPKPTVTWLKDGRKLAEVLGRNYNAYIETPQNLTLILGTEAYGDRKRAIEGNYTCLASNIAGNTSVSSYVTLFGGIQCLPCMRLIPCVQAPTMFSRYSIWSGKNRLCEEASRPISTTPQNCL